MLHLGLVRSNFGVLAFQCGWYICHIQGWLDGIFGDLAFQCGCEISHIQGCLDGMFLGSWIWFGVNKQPHNALNWA